MKGSAGRFEKSPIDQALVTRLVIEPLKQIVIRIFSVNNASSGGREYELYFSKIAAFKIDGIVNRSQKILSHRVFDNSGYLTGIQSTLAKTAAKMNGKKLRHFLLVFEAGEINVVAERCSCILIWEI